MGSDRSRTGARLAQAAMAEGAELQRLLRLARHGNDRALHHARKSLQRMRAMARLLKPIDAALAQRENRRLRRLRRSLAPLRDTAVCAQTLKQLAKRRELKSFAPRLDELAEVERRRHREQWLSHGPDHRLWREAEQACLHLLGRIPRWPLAQLKKKQLDRSLLRAATRLRLQVATARGEPGRSVRHLMRRRLRQATVMGRVVTDARSVEDETLGKFAALAKSCGAEGDLWMAVVRIRRAAATDASLRPLARSLEAERRALCRRNDRKLQRAGIGG